MNTVEFIDVQLDLLITHFVGNKNREEGYKISESTTFIKQESEDYLMRYFLSSFQLNEFNSFTHPIKIEMNEVYSIVKTLFKSQANFVEQSSNLLKLLYESADHPNIKSGEFNIAYFKQVSFNDEEVDAIGIFKSEVDVPFIKMMERESNYFIEHDTGYDLNKIDKGCLIFNSQPKEGYQVLVLDKTNKNDAQYWVDDFLQLKPNGDEYHQTTNFMKITNEYISSEMADEFEINKTDKIDLLNRSMEYFKSAEMISKKDFERNVLQDEAVIKSYQKFDNAFRTSHEISSDDGFEISQPAVKKQARFFKSILKLDKNFHVYIHGDKSLIEQGVDENGRKFYKLFYYQES